MTAIEISVLRQTADCAAADWNSLLSSVAPGGYPFLRHEFLCTLEATGCVGPDVGWQPWHLLATANGQPVGILPQFLKADSFGEFVFDWQWASAYEQAGGQYYPKLVTASPFCPIPGPRILADDATVRSALIKAQTETLEELKFSSAHLLFVDARDRESLLAEGLPERLTWQYQWHNQGYSDFNDFLNKLLPKKRKQIRRERRLVAEAGVTTRWLTGPAIADADWENIYRCYAQTYAERGSTPYLRPAFFPALAAAMPDTLNILLAERLGEIVAVSICLRDADTLYGRYWGSLAHIDCLHFELCYYGGIEHAIEQGLRSYDAGVQGEHKLARGFEPLAASSFHRIADPGFRHAVEDFVLRERRLVNDQLEEFARHSAYR